MGKTQVRTTKHIFIDSTCSVQLHTASRMETRTGTLLKRTAAVIPSIVENDQLWLPWHSHGADGPGGILPRPVVSSCGYSKISVLSFTSYLGSPVEVRSSGRKAVWKGASWACSSIWSGCLLVVCLCGGIRGMSNMSCRVSALTCVFVCTGALTPLSQGRSQS